MRLVAVSIGVLLAGWGLNAQILPDNLVITSTTPPPYQANLSITTSTASPPALINGTSTTTYGAGSSVRLEAGFHAVANAAAGTTPTFVAAVVQPPLYPNSNSASGNSSQTFQVGASDPSGLTSIQLIFNWQPTGVDGCSIYYDVVNDALSVGDLTGSFAAFGQMSLQSPSGTSGDLVNSNCAIMGAGSSVTETLGPPGTGGVRPVLSLSMQLGITFRGASTGTPGFVGQQNIYMMKGASNEPAGAFQQVGTWTAYPAPDPGYYSNVAAPGSTVNQDGTVTVAFYDSNGFNYQPYAEIVFSATSSNPAADPNACRIRYDRGTGSSNHVLGLYSGDFSAGSLWGAAPVGQAGAIVQRNQNCSLDIGRSYVGPETGTGVSVNLALTFPTKGMNYYWMRSFDRQNAGGAVQVGSLNIPPDSFTLNSPTASIMLQQGASASYSMNAPATGRFSGTVNLSGMATNNVAVSFPGGSSVASNGSTTFTVTVPGNANIGTGTVTIIGTSGSISYTLNIPLTVQASSGGGGGTISATPTFTLSGVQLDTAAQSGTFTVALTPLNGLSPTTPVSVYLDTYYDTVINASISTSSVNANGSFTGTVSIIDGAVDYGGPQCAVVNARIAANTGDTPQQIELCVNAGSTTVISLPQSSPMITIPSGGSVTVQGTVSGSPSLAGTVTCQSGVPICDANATFGTVVNGVVPITLNSVDVPVGTVVSYQISANGVAAYVSATVALCSGCSAENVSTSSNTTYNDGVLRSFPYHCVNCTSAYDVKSCSTSDSAVQTTISRISTGSPNFYINFTANSSSQAATDSVSCSFYSGTGVSAGSLVVKSAASAPSITSICLTASANPTSPSCPEATIPSAASTSITINGSNLTNPSSSAAPTIYFGLAGQTGIPLSASPTAWTSTRVDAVVTAGANSAGQYPVTVFPEGYGAQGFQSSTQPPSNSVYVAVSSQACTPTITGVGVDGQSTNTIIAGTSGYVSIFGTCLSGVQGVQPGGSGISISSFTSTLLDTNNDYQVNAFFQSSGNSSTGSQTWTLSFSQGTASTTLFVTALKLHSFSFGNSVLYSRDCPGNATPIPSPTWPAPTSSVMCPQIGFTGDHAVYKSGDTMSGTVMFDVSPSPPAGVSGIYVQGTTQSWGTFMATTGTVVSLAANGSTFSVPVTVNMAFATSQTQFINTLNIAWNVAQSGTSCASNACVAVGSSANPVYVTLAGNVLPSGATVMLTYASLAVGNGGAMSQAAAVSNAWNQFSTGSGPADVKSWSGTPLVYYPAAVGFTSCATDAGSLLTTMNGNGQCGSFARLFESALAMNGITSENSPAPVVASTGLQAVFTGVCPTDSTEMLIKNWAFSPSPRYGEQPQYMYAMTQNSPDYMVPPPGGTGSVGYGDLTNLEGAPGQNSSPSPAVPPNTPSEKIFNSHFIIRIASGLTGGLGPFFDPSYGLTYSNEADFEGQSVAGYAMQDSSFPGNPTRFVARKPSGPVNITWVYGLSTPPTLSSPSNGASGQPVSVVLSWLPSDQTTLYALNLNSSSTSYGPYYVSGTTFSFVLSGLAPGTTYYWRVSASNCWQQSPQSSPTWSFTTAP